MAALFAGLFPNAQLADQVVGNEAGQAKTGEAGAAQPAAAFRDCPECPEMVVVPAGNFTMGSSDSEKSWAASHGGNAIGIVILRWDIFAVFETESPEIVAPQVSRLLDRQAQFP